MKKLGYIWPVLGTALLSKWTLSHDAILTGKQSGQKLQRLCGNPKANSLCQNFVNHNLKILGRRLYLSTLEDVAWLEDAQLIFLIFLTFVCKMWPGRWRLEAVRGITLQTNVWKIRKINRASSSQPTSFNLGEYNLLPSIVTFWFTNWVKINFEKSYLPSDSDTNTMISDRFAYSSLLITRDLKHRQRMGRRRRVKLL